MIIDAHMHIYPRFEGFDDHGESRSIGYGKTLNALGHVQRVTPPAFVETSFPPEMAIEYMDWVGIDKAVLLQAPMYGFWNEYVAEAVRRWPDRLLGTANVDPYHLHGESILRHKFE